MYSTLRAALRRSNLLQAILYSGLPALRPAGRTSCVQICSRRICRTSYRFSFLPLSSINAHLHQRLYLAGPGGLLRASCPPPCGPHFVRSNLLPANLSNLLSVLIFTTFIYIRSFTSAFIFGWAGRIRTSACQDQNLVPYRLATAQYQYTFFRYQHFLACEGSCQDPIIINLAGALPLGDGPISIHFLPLPTLPGMRRFMPGSHNH